MKKNDWIGIRDRLPRQGKEVLVAWKRYSGEKDIVIGQIFKVNKGDWYFTYCDVNGTNSLDDSQVTHWMLLPNLPKQ